MFNKIKKHSFFKKNNDYLIKWVEFFRNAHEISDDIQRCYVL